MATSWKAFSLIGCLATGVRADAIIVHSWQAEAPSLGLGTVQGRESLRIQGMKARWQRHFDVNAGPAGVLANAQDLVAIVRLDHNAIWYLDTPNDLFQEVPLERWNALAAQQGWTLQVSTSGLFAAASVEPGEERVLQSGQQDSCDVASVCTRTAYELELVVRPAPPGAPLHVRVEDTLWTADVNSQISDERKVFEQTFEGKTGTDTNEFEHLSIWLPAEILGVQPQRLQSVFERRVVPRSPGVLLRRQMRWWSNDPRIQANVNQLLGRTSTTTVHEALASPFLTSTWTIISWDSYPIRPQVFEYPAWYKPMHYASTKDQE